MNAAARLQTVRSTLDHLLYDWLQVQQLCTRPRYAEHDRASFDAVLDLGQKLAAEQFAPHDRSADIDEPRMDGARVLLPAGTLQACRAYAASGLGAAAQDYAYGGMQLPCCVETAANSFFSAASIALRGYALITTASANLLMAHGSERQKDVFARALLDGRSYGAMNLSEPQAGSSLSDIVTSAVADGADYAADPLGPRYRVSGRKMWISCGEHEIGDNIVQLVLARTADAQGRYAAGTRALSLFIVPKWLLDEQGLRTGERNDIALAGLNHKLGYRGTVNTVLHYGEGAHPLRGGAGAIGYRVGAVGQGLACMFHMMNEARIQVGLGAAMLGYAGYLAALDYARERRQGRAPGGGAPVAIVEHADVKRMLLAQKAYCEGALALQLRCALWVDQQRGGDQEAALLLDLLTPVAKSWPSEWCLEGNSLAIQVHGGYGYTRDFPVEQYWRDNRLNMIHEGTHGIQALDLLGRKLRLADGAALRLFAQRVQVTAASASAHAALVGAAAQLSVAMARLQATAHALLAHEDAAAALANATPFLQAFGHVVLAWVWLDLACCSTRALAATPSAGDDDFHHGKLAASAYFFAYELPKIEAWLAVAARCDSTCRDVQPGWF